MYVLGVFLVCVLEVCFFLGIDEDLAATMVDGNNEELSTLHVWTIRWWSSDAQRAALVENVTTPSC